MRHPSISANRQRALTLFHRLLLSIFIISSTPLAYGGQKFDSDGKQVILVELFTSQGCSSCPPAERWLGQLRDDQRLWQEIIPVAFHVDYWDYIGWQDTYAKPEFSAKQHDYRKKGHVSSVYTPGFVVNGAEWRGWFRQRILPNSNRLSGRLKVELNGSHIRAHYLRTGKDREPLLLNIALLGVGLEADVSRGENSGKRLEQDFVVLDYHKVLSNVATWDTELATTQVSKDTRLALAAWVSGANSMTPLQAVGGWLDR